MGGTLNEPPQLRDCPAGRGLGAPLQGNEGGFQGKRGKNER